MAQTTYTPKDHAKILIREDVLKMHIEKYRANGFYLPALLKEVVTGLSLFAASASASKSPIGSMTLEQWKMTTLLVAIGILAIGLYDLFKPIFSKHGSLDKAISQIREAREADPKTKATPIAPS